MESWAKPRGNLSSCRASVRLRVGVVALGVALALAVVLVKAEVAPAFRWLLFVPFLLAASGFYQGLFRT